MSSEISSGFTVCHLFPLCGNNLYIPNPYHTACLPPENRRITDRQNARNRLLVLSSAGQARPPLAEEDVPDISVKSTATGLRHT